MDQPVVTEMLPADNVFVQIMKLLFCLNLMISYPITITPAYTTLEALLGKEETKVEEDDEDNDNDSGDGTQRAGGETLKQYWIINAMRSFVVLCTVVVVVLVYAKLTTFISVVGGVFGMINVLLLPSIAHLKLVAKTAN